MTAHRRVDEAHRDGVDLDLPHSRVGQRARNALHEEARHGARPPRARPPPPRAAGQHARAPPRCPRPAARVPLPPAACPLAGARARAQWRAPRAALAPSPARRQRASYRPTAAPRARARLGSGSCCARNRIRSSGVAPWSDRRVEASGSVTFRGARLDRSIDCIHLGSFRGKCTIRMLCQCGWW